MVFVFLLLAAAGLMYVKWWPYYHKALTVSDTHSIGKSILGEPVTHAGRPTWNGAVDYAVLYFKSVWKAAVLGLLLGSLLQVLIPVRWLHRLFGKSNFASVLCGGIVSLPGMMCTCCAAPIAVGLRRKNVSAGSALAFWIGNPLLNPATLVFMAFVLSWKFTVLRIVLGILLTFGVGYIANRMMRGQETEMMPDMLVSDAAAMESTSASFWSRWMKSLGKMLLQVVPAYFIAVLVLGAMKVWLFPLSAGSGIIMVLLFAVAGTLFVIPTAAEIPIIQSFMAIGIAAGPVSALLLTLPAISLPSLLMVSRSFPRKILLLVLASVIATGVVSAIIGSLWI
ncbi:permease [Gorillibacterium massiliense]|uniref:permease n=1 Tax=Gorillibacterium massiliense TaxID=1280390 RepID=UPI0009DDD215|nr:permease [Gorillibacterium massiliense]